MDVHRSRFVPYPTSAINALAFSKSSGSDRLLRLAVGRANGDIEIWNPAKGSWVQETTFVGGRDRSVEGLAWIQEPDEQDEGGATRQGPLRLFSIGHSSSVTEWDLATGLPLRHSSGNSSEVWCVAAQPSWEAKKGHNDEEAARSGQHQGQNLVAGCADGTLVLLSTANDDLQFQRYLTRPTRKQARCLCVTFQNRNTVVAGFADSRVRVYDIRSGSTIRDISMGAGPKGAPKDVLVWAVQCLPNGDIVTGDSSGEVTIFDGRLYSPLQRIAGGHEGDVLAVAVSNDGKTIFSTGIDRRTVAYQAQTNTGFQKRTFWSQISHQRYHSHDVKALASFESKRMSILVSGGVDTQLNVLPIREFGEENSRGIFGLPQLPPVASAQSGRLLLSWWNRELWIWQVQQGSSRFESPKLLTKMNLKGDENITSASISNDGTLLALSTTAEVRLFQTRVKDYETSQTIRVRKLDAPKALQNRGARLLKMSLDGKWLVIVRPNSDIQLCRIVPSKDTMDQPHIVSTLADMSRLVQGKRGQKRGYFTSVSGNYLQTITRIEFSHDSHFLAASDLSGQLDSWVLLGHEDSTAPEVDVKQDESTDSEKEDEDEENVTYLGQRWVHNPSANMLPKTESAPLLITFRPPKPGRRLLEPNGNPGMHATRHNAHPQPLGKPKGPYDLVVLDASHQLYEFDMLHGKQTKWSARNTGPLPEDFQTLRDRAMGCVWHVTSHWERLWLYGSKWVFMFDMAQDFADGDGQAVAGAEGGKSKKRKRDERRVSQPLSSGAGSRKRDEEALGLKRRVRKLVEGSNDEWKGFDQPDQSDEAGDVDMEDENAPLRPVRSHLEESAKQDEDGEDEQRPPAKWWHTFKYRPIMGVVPLSEEIGEEIQSNDQHKEAADALEVVLIERPTWDLDLPAPFRGIHERD